MDTETTPPRIIETDGSLGMLSQLQERYVNRRLHTIHGALVTYASFRCIHFIADAMQADVVIVNSYDLILPDARAALDVVLDACPGEVILLVWPAPKTALALASGLPIDYLSAPPIELADVSGLVR